MSLSFIHNEYFRARLQDRSVYQFKDLADAKNKVGFHNDFITCGNPKLTYLIEDNDTTLKVVMEFKTKEDQDFWKKSVDALGNDFRNKNIEFFKIEWCDTNGAPESTTLHENNIQYDF